MTLTDLFAKDAKASLDLSLLPDDNEISEIAKSARRLVEVSEEIEQTAKLLFDLETEKKKLESETLPALMTEAQITNIGVRDADIVLAPYARASIPVSWPPVERAKAFEHLTALGAGDIIKAEVTVAFPREEIAIARRFAEAARVYLKTKTKSSLPPEAVKLDMSVHHGTLTSWLIGYLNEPVREGSNRPPLEPSRIGAMIGYVAKIIPRGKKIKFGRGVKK